MKVLVVDDEVIVARALGRAFQSKGHTVTLAYTGEEGLEKWLEINPDIIFLDVVMPALTGPQVIQEFKKRNAAQTKTKIILMTAHSGVKGHEAALNLGADDFIQKPFEDIFNLVAKTELLLKA
jgi:DNA-binding response OmpR family regulator